MREGCWYSHGCSNANDKNKCDTCYACFINFEPTEEYLKQFVANTYVICKNDFPIAAVSDKRLADQYKDILQKHFDAEKRMKELRGASYQDKSYIHVHEIPELKNTADVIKQLKLNSKVPELLAFWEAEHSKAGENIG